MATYPVSPRPIMHRPGIMKRIPWMGLAFVAPGLVVFILFKYYPLAKAFYISFFDYSPIAPPGPFVGWGNYSAAFATDTFWQVSVTTIVLFLFGMLFGFWPPILQALLLDRIKVGHKAYRFCLMLPWAIPGIAGLTLWKWIYNPDYGLLNDLLKHIGLGSYLWLSDPHMAKQALTMMGLLGGGLNVVIYLAAIQGISHEIYEAAEVDGATAWQRIWKITVPCIMPIVKVMFVLALAGSLLAFDAPFVLTGGGPAGSTQTLVMLVYQKAMIEYKLGAACAIAVLIFIVTIIVAAIQLRLNRESAN